jgi:hypothetical protein
LLDGLTDLFYSSVPDCPISKYSIALNYTVIGTPIDAYKEYIVFMVQLDHNVLARTTHV